MKRPPVKIKDGKQLHRIAQQPTLAAFLPWGDLAGADRVALAGGKGRKKLLPCSGGRYFGLKN